MTIATSLPARPSSPGDVGDYLAKVETERRRQLDSLPEDTIDTVERAYRTTLERIIDEVGKARERHQAGLYGVCAGCDGAIDPDRLDFRPWATMCTECSKKLA